jgi:cell division protein DivIC
MFRKVIKNKILIIFLIIIVWVLIAFAKKHQLDQLSKQADVERSIESIEANIDYEKEREIDLKKKQTFQKTRDYIEDIARQKHGLIGPDEIIIKPSE